MNQPLHADRPVAESRASSGFTVLIATKESSTVCQATLANQQDKGFFFLCDHMTVLD